MILLLLLILGHYIGDYTPLSTPKMLKAKQFSKPLFPIFEHALVHGAIFCIIYFYYQAVIYTFNNIGDLSYDAYLNYSFNCIIPTLILLIIHFLIDVGKGKITYYIKQTQDISKPPFWMLHGLDQFLHIVTIIIIHNQIQDI